MKEVKPQVQVLRPEATTQSLRERAEGRARNGFVRLIHFDEGLLTTMGGVKSDNNQYYLSVCNVDGPPSAPLSKDCCYLQIPIVWSIPEDVMQKATNPMILVQRNSIQPNLTRWMPGQLQYRVPSYSAKKYTFGLGKSYQKEGYDEMEQRQMAVPYDIAYTVSIIARYRPQADEILFQLMQTFQPHTYIKIIDSIGDERTYEATTESIVPLDSLPEISERVIGFSLSLLVMAELDLAPTEIYNTVIQSPTLTMESL